MAKRGLRCICLAYRDLAAPEPGPEFLDDPANLVDNLTAYAVVGIKVGLLSLGPDGKALSCAWT